MTESLPTEFMPAVVPWPIRVVNFLRYDITAILCALAIAAPFAFVGLFFSRGDIVQKLANILPLLGIWAGFFWLAARLLKIFITGERGRPFLNGFLLMNLTLFLAATLTHIASTGRRMSLSELQMLANTLAFPYVLLLIMLPFFEWAVKRLAQVEERRRLAGEHLAIQRREWRQ